jgi:chromosome segregation ATPase
MVISSSIPFLIGMVAAVIASLLGATFALLGERKRKEKAPTLEDKITILTENLKSSLSAISEIETEINKRSGIAEKLKNDVQRYEQLKELSQSQVEAVAQTIRSEITAESKTSMWRNAIITFVIALAFFFLGWWVGGI